MPIKIAGTGLGRTGTYSLKLALEHLGFGKCYHMTELFQYPEGVRHFRLAERGDKINWENIFSEYNSTVDYPGARYFEQITKHYPEAKVIHTYRNSDEWYESAVRTILAARNLKFGQYVKFAALFPFSSNIQKRLNAFLFSRKLIALEFGKDYSDKKKITGKYEKHTENVIKKINPNRLLIYNVSEGWEPLCRFLNVPVPEKEFPVTNTQEEFYRKIEIIGKGKFLPEIKL